MRKWKKNCRIGILSMLIIPTFSTFIAYAAPTISIQQGNPPNKTKPPYTVLFSVSDPAGVVSIVVNGRELGPNGGDYYEADYTTYYNGSVTISAVNRNGETSSDVVRITNLATAIEQSEVPAPPPTQAQPQTSAPPQTEAPTQAQTTQARVSETTKARETEATLPVETSETETSEVETSEAETAPEESSVVEESSQETQEESINEETVNETSEAETEEVSQAPELPPDSYKLYPGGRKNMIIPKILISACICAIGYLIVTLILNRKRLEKYKQLNDILVKRQDMISQRNYEELNENTIDGLPDDDCEEDENEK